MKRICAVLATSAVLLLTGAVDAIAGTFTAFGPQLYPVENGQPTTVTTSFEVLNPGTYTLRVYNGGVSGAYERVSSAAITLNGVLAFSPTQINPDRASIHKFVTLAQSNQLDVQVVGVAGAALTLEITGVDNVLPTVRAVVTPASNEHGWNNTDVTVTFECTDARAGIATCPPPVSLSAEGAQQVVSGTATDRAGNTASASATISIDKTNPLITVALQPSANAMGWHNTDVKATYSCSDALSGVSACPWPTLFSSEGAGQERTVTARDAAGNTATHTTTVNIDKTPPVVTPSLDQPLSDWGWYRRPVTVRFDCADALSGVYTYPEPIPVRDEGAGLLVEAMAVDNAGNSATATASLNIDLTPPSLTVQVTPLPDARGCSSADVTLAFSCTDDLSGPSACPPDQTVLRTNGNQVISVTAMDAAENSAVLDVPISFNELPDSVDGELHPSLVSDRVAYGFFLRSIALPPEAASLGQELVITKLRQIELTESEITALLRIAWEWVQALNALNARATEVRQSPQARAAWLAEKEATLDSLVSSIPARVGLAASKLIATHVRGDTKRSIRMFATNPPVPCGTN